MANRKLQLVDQLPLFTGNPMLNAEYQEIDKPNIPDQAPIKYFDPSDEAPAVDLSLIPERNRELNWALDTYTSANKGARVARFDATDELLEEIDATHPGGVDGVIQNRIDNLEISRKHFKKACEACPYMGKCALAGDFNKFFGTERKENFYYGEERDKLKTEITKNPAQNCDETLDLAQSRKRKTAA